MKKKIDKKNAITKAGYFAIATADVRQREMRMKLKQI